MQKTKINLEEFKEYAINPNSIFGGECDTCDGITHADDTTTGDLLNRDTSNCVLFGQSYTDSNEDVCTAGAGN